MSIHKSKGLEFPVVYVAGLGKQFNFMDGNGSIVLHSKLGIGSDVIDSALRTRESSLLKQVIRQKMVKETLGEELRILYVAMTRAKEKLVLCGLGDLKKWVESCGYLLYDRRMHLYYRRLAGAKCYMDWVLPAIAGHRCFDPVYEMFGITRQEESDLYQAAPRIRVQVITPANLLKTEMFHQMDAVVKKKELLEWDTDKIRDTKTKTALQERFSYRYPYENLEMIPVKMTVSELKKAGDEEPGEELYFESDLVPLIPEFIKDAKEPPEGAARGTVYHKVLECLNYGRLETCLEQSRTELEFQVEQMIQAGKLSKEDAGCLNLGDLEGFLHTELGSRMYQAGLNGTLFREQPFVIGISASEVHPSWPVQEKILVQGIIDAFFEEEGQLVIVDYKTDKVSDRSGQELVEKYRKQLLYYKRALEQVTGKIVKEMYIYSIALGREILVS